MNYTVYYTELFSCQ